MPVNLNFDPSTANPINETIGFDPSTASPVNPLKFDPSTAVSFVSESETQPVDEGPKMEPWEPSLWERVTSIFSSPEQSKARAANEYAAQEVAREEGVTIEEAYRKVGGERPLFNPEGRDKIKAITEAGSIVAKQLPYVPEAAANTVLRVIRGGDESVEDTLLDRAIKATEIEKPEYVDPNYPAFNDIAQSLGYSLSTLTSSALAGAGVTMATGQPALGATAAFSVSGGVAYRASKDQFLDRVKEAVGEKYQAVHGEPLPQDEWDKALVEYDSAATKYGAWEAIPEAASNLIFMRALASPLKLAGNAKVIDTAIKAAQVMVSEQATETATGVGQSIAEEEAGLGERKTISEAFREQAIQTALITGMLGAGAGLGRKGFSAAERKIAPGRVLARELEADVARAEFAVPAETVAVIALGPAQAQLHQAKKVEQETLDTIAVIDSTVTVDDAIEAAAIQVDQPVDVFDPDTAVLVSEDQAIEEAFEPETATPISDDITDVQPDNAIREEFERDSAIDFETEDLTNSEKILAEIVYEATQMEGIDQGTVNEILTQHDGGSEIQAAREIRNVITERQLSRLQDEPSLEGFAGITEQESAVAQAAPAEGVTGEQGVLETYTEEDLKNLELQRQAQAAMVAQDQKRADIAVTADDFTLTGSDREADVATSKGQDNMFSESLTAVEPSMVTGRLGTVTREEVQQVEEAAAERAIKSGFGLVNDLRDHFNIPVRQGRITAPGAAGIHGKKTGVVRLRNMADIEVFAHELGHALESRYGDSLTQLVKLHEIEIAPLSYDQTLPEEQLLREGFAEFHRIYVANRPFVEKNAPEFTAAYESYMQANHPADLQKIQQAGDMYQQYLKAPSKVAVAANISSGDRGSFFKRFKMAVNPKNLGDNLRALAQDAYTSFIDRQHPIYVAEQRLKAIHDKKGGKRLDLKRAEESHVLARLALDAYSAGQVQLEHGVIPYNDIYPEGPSLHDALRTALGGVFNEATIKDFGSYLVSRRAVHEWDRYNSGELSQRPTQQTRIDHVKNISALESDHSEYKVAAEQVYTFLQNHWKKKYESGLITEDQYNDGMSDHPDYVPFLRDRSDLTEVGAKASVTGISGVIKRFKGSDRPIINPIESIMADVYQTEAMIKGNDARKALADMAEKVEYGGGEIIEKIPASQMKVTSLPFSDVKKALMDQVDWTGLDERDVMGMQTALDGMDDIDAPMLNFFRAGEISEKGEPIIYVWRNGEREAYRLADGDFGLELYNALTGINREQVPAIANFLGITAASLRFGVTMDPTFQVSNTIRGELTAWALDPNYTPIVDFGKGLKSAVAYDEMKQAYTGAGGIMGGVNTNSLGARRAQKDIKQLSKRGIDVRRLSFRDVLAASEVSESAMRIGLFKTTFEKAKQRGLSNKDAVVEASFVARDITDYGRHGSKMAAAQRMVTFLNAALQGIDKFSRTIGGAGSYQKALSLMVKNEQGKTLTGTEKRNLKTARGLALKMGVIGLAGAALAVLYEDDQEYEEFSEYLRASHWMVKLPGGQWAAIPKPFQEALLSNIVERAYEAHYYDDPEAIERMKRSIYQTMGPPMVPAFAKPMIEHFSNKSLYNGMPIIGRRIEGLEPEKQYYSWTSSFAKKIGKELNVSPILIDHYITSYTGTLGRSALSATTAADPKAQEQGLEDMFFVRRFIRDYTRGSVSNEVFYKKLSQTGGEWDAKYRTFKSYVESDNNAEAREYLSKQTDKEAAYIMTRFIGSLKPSMNQTNNHPMTRALKVARKLYGIRRDVRDSDALSPPAKRKLDDAIGERVVMEFRNSMVAVGAPGYAKRKMIDLAENMEVIKSASEPTYIALQNIMKQIPPAEPIYEQYPSFEKAMLDFRDRLLSDDTDIDGDIGNAVDAMTQ